MQNFLCRIWKSGEKPGQDRKTAFHGQPDLAGLFWRGRRQHIASHLLPVAWMSDADAQAPVVPGSQGAVQIPQAIVPTMAARPFEPGGAGGEVQVIMDDQKLCGRDFVEGCHGPDRPAGAVHVILGKTESNIQPINPEPGDFCFPGFFHLPLQAQGVSPLLQKPKTRVMAGSGIFLARISEAGDEPVHGENPGLSGCRRLFPIASSGAVDGDNFLVIPMLQCYQNCPGRDGNL